MVGLTDPQLPRVPDDLRSVVDETTASLNPCFNGGPSIFIDGSPMTHPTRFSLRFQNYSRALRAAVLYDFIPLDWPGYLPTTAQRIEYTAKLARLKKFDLFFPISAYTAWRLAELTGISGERVKVTGACVRRSLYDARRKMTVVPSPYEQPEPYFVTLGGDDRRKNTDVAVRAVRRLNLLYGRRIPLKVIGFYCDEYKADLLRIAGHAAGEGFLEFYPNIPDSEVVNLHSGAIAAICPSRIEGFSLPVAEAAVCGCPVVSSTCAAQIELVTQPEALFHSEDHAALAEKLEALLHNPHIRESLVAAQAHLARDFHADEVGRRFWRTLEEEIDRRTKLNVCRSRLPRLAFLSPYPPDKSSAAIYTANLTQAAAAQFHSDVYSDTDRPLVFEGNYKDGGFVSLAPLVVGNYNSIISVIGDASGQSRILNFFEQFGGPCILHNLRLHTAYFELFGSARFCDFVSGILNRPVAPEEAQTWLQDPNCTLLFLDNLVKRASHLIVHSPAQQALLKKHYNVEAHLATSCPTIQLRDDELTTEARTSTRERLGIASNTFVISSFGRVARHRGMDVCILTVELLRSWNIPAELYFVGDEHPPTAEIQRVAGLYDISDFVHADPEFARDEAYRSFLIASDASLQLRDYAFGQPSSGLINSIAASLPAVATTDMALSCEAPDYVRTVPDRFSPLQTAEQLASIWEMHSDRSEFNEMRLAYLGKHNFEYYSRRLIEILELQ